MPQIRRPAMVVGLSPAGLADYDSLDRQPVHLVVLIAAPQGQHDTYVRLLAQVADVLKDDGRRRCIYESADPQVVFDTLTEGGD